MWVGEDVSFFGHGLLCSQHCRFLNCPLTLAVFELVQDRHTTQAALLVFCSALLQRIQHHNDDDRLFHSV